MSAVRGGGQLVRYSAVSLIATTTSLIVLGLLVAPCVPAGGRTSSPPASAPSPRSSSTGGGCGARPVAVGAQGVIPFSVLSFPGLALSTLAVASRQLGRCSPWRPARTVAVELANLAAFGSLWIAQFVILDRILFRRTARPRRDRASRPRRTGGERDARDPADAR